MEEASARLILGWNEAKPAWTGRWIYFAAQAPSSRPLTPVLRADPLVLKPLLTREELAEYICRSPKLAQRLQYSGWLNPLHDLGTRESLFSRDDAYAAQERLIKGERPQRLPSEPALKRSQKEEELSG